MKIWARLLTNQKIKKDLIYTADNNVGSDNYDDWIREICHTLDIPTPIILPTHYKNFINFHNTKFKQDDFVESLDYDMFIVEDCRE